MKMRKLNRDSNARVALFKGLIATLIDKEEINTTSAKARAVRSLFEKMITKARTGTVHARRLVQSDVQDASLVSKLFSEIAPRYADVKGGYTKLTMVGNRKGDNAPIVKLALTKKSEVKTGLKNKKAVTAAKSDTASRKTETSSAPKLTAPKLAKPTKASKSMGSSVGKVRKTGER